MFEEGSYRIWIDSTERTSGGTTTLNIPERGFYRVEGVQRSRRAPGLALTAAGIVLSGIGAGMAIGGGAFRSGLTSSEEAWFWAGMVTMGTGVALIPVGVHMYSRSLRVEALAPTGAFPEATSTEPLPRRYSERLLREGEPVPSGSTVVEEPRWGLLSAGAITFATSYGIMAGVAAGALAEDEDGDYGLLFIPIFGPSLFDRRRGEGPALTMFGTVPELTGALLMLLGATGTRRFAAQSEPTINVAPLMTPHASGLSVYGAF